MGREVESDLLRKSFPDVGFGALVQVLGMDRVSIGAGTLVSDGAWINVCSPETGSTISIGKCVQIGRYSMLNSGGRMELGDYCLLGAHVIISNADHVIDDIGRPYLDQGARLGGVTVIGDNCWIAGNACVLGSVTLGRGCVVGAGSVVTKDVEPFTVVTGNPGSLVRMYNPVSQAWERVRSEADEERIRNARKQKPLPDAETYRRMLADKAVVKALDPMFAGNGVSL